jgi:hypothetical protein
LHVRPLWFLDATLSPVHSLLAMSSSAMPLLYGTTSFCRLWPMYFAVHNLLRSKFV